MAKRILYWVWCDNCGAVQNAPHGVILKNARRIKNDHTDCGKVSIQKIIRNRLI